MDNSYLERLAREMVDRSDAVRLNGTTKVLLSSKVATQRTVTIQSQLFAPSSIAQQLKSVELIDASGNVITSIKNLSIAAMQGDMTIKFSFEVTGEVVTSA